MNKKFNIYDCVFAFILASIIVLTYVQSYTIQKQSEALNEAYRIIMDVQTTCMMLEQEISNLLDK